MYAIQLVSIHTLRVDRIHTYTHTHIHTCDSNPSLQFLRASICPYSSSLYTLFGLIAFDVVRSLPKLLLLHSVRTASDLPHPGGPNRKTDHLVATASCRRVTFSVCMYVCVLCMYLVATALCRSLTFVFVCVCTCYAYAVMYACI